MEPPDIEFDIFEATCGVTGDFGCCGAEAPLSAYSRLIANRYASVPCTRQPQHAGDHVAADTDGRVLARWRHAATCSEVGS